MKCRGYSLAVAFLVAFSPIVAGSRSQPCSATSATPARTSDEPKNTTASYRGGTSCQNFDFASFTSVAQRNE